MVQEGHWYYLKDNKNAKHLEPDTSLSKDS